MTELKDSQMEATERMLAKTRALFYTHNTLVYTLKAGEAYILHPSAHDMVQKLTEANIETAGGRKFLDTTATLDSPEVSFQALRKAVADEKMKEITVITAHWTLADYFLVMRQAIRHYAEQNDSR